MIIGMILMIAGAVLLTRNKNLAYLFAREQAHHWAFTSSIARQNLAIMGTVFFIGGLVFFFLF